MPFPQKVLVSWSLSHGTAPFHSYNLPLPFTLSYMSTIESHQVLKSIPSAIIMARATISNLDPSNGLFNELSMSILEVTVYPEFKVIFLEHGSDYMPFLLKLCTVIGPSDLATDHFFSLALPHLARSPSLFCSAFHPHSPSSSSSGKSCTLLPQDLYTCCLFPQPRMSHISSSLLPG